MKRLVAALAWKRSSDEKIPLSTKKCVPDNGTIAKDSPPEQTTEKAPKMTDSKSVDPENVSTKLEPMSLLRTLAMFLSMNIIALYFVAFAFLIPCRILNCQSRREWSVNLNNISISTNLEITGDSTGSKLLLFGYYLEGSEGNSTGVTALLSSSGTLEWQEPLNFSPVHCHCNAVDVNRDGVKDCLIFGGNHLLALNASNGYVWWSRQFGTITSVFADVRGCDISTTRTGWIILVENRHAINGQIPNGRIGMVILDSKNGTVVNYLPLRCDSPPKQIVTWKSRSNATYLSFQCSYNSTTEVQMIAERELCNLVLGRSELKMKGFTRLFSFGSSTSVDDVLLLPVSHVGLLVGWSTMIAMATDARNPPRLLWQTTSRSIRSAIKYIVDGHFTSKNSTQIAIAIQGNSSSSIKVVDVLKGKEVASVDLGPGTLSSVLPVYRMMNNSDSLLIIKGLR